MKRFALLFLLATAGCLKIAPADGALHCSTVGSKCPSGYYCADDNTCWHTGSAPSLDMSVGGTDDLGDTGDGGGPADLSPPPVSFCMVPSDCTMTLPACLSPVCVGSVCGSVGTAQGTAAPPSSQVKGDCQTRICDGNGNVTTKPDNTNLPTDATGGCYTMGCNNGAPTMTPTMPGTACTQHAGGICNGAGVCGVCKPGTSQCATDGKTIQNCSTDGQWVNGTTCSYACTAGACSGSCTMGVDQPYCSGIDQLHTCDASHNWVTTTCTYACSGTNPGACTGTCKPSGNTCNGNTVTWCDSTGTPKQMACAGSTPVCLGGSCVQCSPNAVGCCTASNGFAGNQSCSAAGTWGTCNACGGNSSYTCSSGACGCTPNDPCANQVCGSAVNSCGTTVTCTNTCAASGDICAYNSTTHTYYCKAPATGGTCCGTTSACCSAYCC